MSQAVREFGTVSPDAKYILRPGGYAVVRDRSARVLLVREGNGWFLPGGGQEASESAAQAAVRETREECGIEIRISGQIGVADELVLSSAEGAHFRKRCTFFLAEPQGAADAIRTAGQETSWVSATEAIDLLSHESQKWAVRSSVSLRPESA